MNRLVKNQLVVFFCCGVNRTEWPIVKYLVSKAFSSHRIGVDVAIISTAPASLKSVHVRMYVACLATKTILRHLLQIHAICSSEGIKLIVDVIDPVVWVNGFVVN